MKKLNTKNHWKIFNKNLDLLLKNTHKGFKDRHGIRGYRAADKKNTFTLRKSIATTTAAEAAVGCRKVLLALTRRRRPCERWATS